MHAGPGQIPCPSSCKASTQISSDNIRWYIQSSFALMIGLIWIQAIFYIFFYSFCLVDLHQEKCGETLGDLAWRRTQEPPFIKRLVNDPLLQHIKLIAEPWDCAWPDGSFGSRWLVPKSECGLSGGLVPIKRWSKYFHVSRIWCAKKHLYSRVCFFFNFCWHTTWINGWWQETDMCQRVWVWQAKGCMKYSLKCLSSALRFC